jgi:hypothetical protein
MALKYNLMDRITSYVTKFEYIYKIYLITIQGDGRANQHPSLAIMQNLWLREHNRIAAQLGNINPGWNDETLFQASMKNPSHF